MSTDVTVDPQPAATFDVVMPVWGPEFIDLLCDVCIPNQLSAGNLDALPPGSRYRIFTRTSDVETLSMRPQLEGVRRLLPVDVVGVHDADRGTTAQIKTRYKLMTACQRRAVSDAAERRAALMFLSPDFVFAEGTLAALVRLHASGARAVLSANLRLAREAVVAAMARRGVDRGFAPRDLVRLALECLHPATESMMVDSSNTNTFPEVVIWPVRARTGALDGLLVRSFSLHPVLLDPIKRLELPRATADGHHLMRTGLKLKQCHIIQDSDEAAIFELTPADRVIGNRAGGGGLSMRRLASVASRVDRYQQSHWQHAIRLHPGDLDERWTAVHESSVRLVDRLERYRPYGPALFQTYRAFHIARQRRDAWLRRARRSWRARVGGKHLVRPVRVQLHRLVKASLVRLKRARRLMRVMRSA